MPPNTPNQPSAKSGETRRPLVQLRVAGTRPEYRYDLQVTTEHVDEMLGILQKIRRSLERDERARIAEMDFLI